jgi:hypothetical protein
MGARLHGIGSEEKEKKRWCSCSCSVPPFLPHWLAAWTGGRTYTFIDTHTHTSGAAGPCTCSWWFSAKVVLKWGISVD